MNWSARSVLIAWLVGATALAATAWPRRRVSDASDQARRSLCRGRSDRYSRPAGGGFSRQGFGAGGVRREQGRGAGRDRRRSGGACRADGYTLLVVAGSIIVQNPLLYKKLSYDPARDFRMLALVTELPVVMEVHPSVPARRWRNSSPTPNKIPASSVSVRPGQEAPFILAGEMFKQMAGIEMTHVPYKGAGPALTDLSGGQHPGHVRLR